MPFERRSKTLLRVVPKLFKSGAEFGGPVGRVVEWLKHRTDDQHGLGSKPTRAILLCSWERHFTALSPCLVVLTSSSKLQ